MSSYIIKGSKDLSGEIKVSGSKNALLPILAASCICKGITTLYNVAPLEDTYSMIKILRYLDVVVLYDNKDKMIIDSRNIKNKKLYIEEIGKLRASYYFMGALSSLYKNVNISSPGGCKFMSRPIDLHLFAFEKLGITTSQKDNIYSFKKDKPKCKTINFERVSVGATINAILASIKISGKVIINNTAKEPEVDDLILYLNKCGAKIERKENSIIIKGSTKLKGCTHYIIDDRIEAQTYLILGALLGRNLKIKYNYKEHISAMIKMFSELNIDLKEYKEGYIVNKINNIKPMNLTFDVYPSLPTDIQPVLSILFTHCKGESEFIDKVYPSRYSQVNELVSMGYNFRIYQDKLVIRKNMNYLDSEVECKDLRGGMSLVVAALVSNNTTKINNVFHIKRGYHDLVNKLKKVGAIIEEV